MSHSGNDEIIDNKRDREKWLIASTCIMCKEMGDVPHTAFAHDEEDGNFALYIFDSKREAELYIIKEMKEDNFDYVWATPQKDNM